MYSPLDLHQLATEEYNRGLRKAAQGRLVSLVLRRQNNLLSLDALMQRFRIIGQRSLGTQTVAIEAIVGTAGRTEDFDRSFMPKRDLTQHRLISVIKAMYEGITLPPVELRKVGKVYFVIDGHHRISAARLRGQQFIEAIVTEVDMAIDDTGVFKIICT